MLLLPKHNASRVHPREPAVVEGDVQHGVSKEGASTLGELCLEDQLLLERTWARWHGFSVLASELREILRIDTHRHHSWVILALQRGVEETTAQLSSVMDTLSIISGLFIILCFQFLYSPPSGLLDEQTEGSWPTIVFNATNICSVSCYFLCIMFGSCTGTAFRFAMRDVDKLRVLMFSNGSSPSATLFTGGCCFASLAAGASASGIVGTGTGAAILGSTLVVGVLAYLLSRKLLRTGHVRYAWKSGLLGPLDPPDFRLILSRTERLIAVDELYRAGRLGEAVQLLQRIASTA